MARLNELYPPAGILDALEGASGEVRIEAGGRTFFAAVDPAGAAAFKAEYPEAVIVQGGTDVGVWCNKRFFEPEAVLNISKIPELRKIGVHDGVLEVGGGVTLETLQAHVKDLVPELWKILDWFGAPQIRSAGTLAGNIANGSPIADTLPFLYVMEAELELAGPRRGEAVIEDGGLRIEDGGPGAIARRRISILGFYKGYKEFDLEPGEFITRVLIPLPAGDQVLRLHKVSKRQDLDISTFTAGFLMRQRGEVIDEIRIAYGGVGPVVYRLAKTEAFLTGKPATEEVFREAGAIAREEIAPISDVRGTAGYRFTLAERILLRFFHETAGAEVAA